MLRPATGLKSSFRPSVQCDCPRERVRCRVDLANGHWSFHRLVGELEGLTTVYVEADVFPRRDWVLIMDLRRFKRGVEPVTSHRNELSSLDLGTRALNVLRVCKAATRSERPLRLIRENLGLICAF